MGHGLWNESFGRIGAMLKELEIRGVADDHLGEILRSPVLADKLANLLKAKGHTPEERKLHESLSIAIDRGIVEKESKKYLYFDPGYSIQMMREIEGVKQRRLFDPKEWYPFSHLPWTNETAKPRWRCMRMPILTSCNSNISAQRCSLHSNEEIAAPRDILMFCILYIFVKNRPPLQANQKIRTSTRIYPDLPQNQHSVCIAISEVAPFSVHQLDGQYTCSQLYIAGVMDADDPLVGGSQGLIG